jgi:hypothetical protein
MKINSRFLNRNQREWNGLFHVLKEKKAGEKPASKESYTFMLYSKKKERNKNFSKEANIRGIITTTLFIQTFLREPYNCKS